MAKGAVIMAVFILSLFFSAGLVAFFDVGFNGSTQITSLNLPLSLPSYFGPQNYLNGEYNSSINSITGIGNEWEFLAGEGMVHTSVSLIPSQNYFFITNLLPSSNNVYTNTYIINNDIQKPYGIVLRGTSNFDQNDIWIDETGFHIPSYSFFGIKKGETDFISYPNVHLIEHPTIKTIYREGGVFEPSSCTILFNSEIFTFTKLNNQDLATSNIIRNIYFAGVYSSSVGTTLEFFNSENSIVNPDAKALTGSDPLTLVSSLIISVTKLISFTFPYDIIPLWLQVFIFLPQEFMIVVGLALFIREG